MQAVFLDADTLGEWTLDPQTQTNAIDLSTLSALFSTLKVYGLTSPDEVIERCQDAQVVITNKVVLSKALIQQLPKLKIIQLAATGMDNVDVEFAQIRNIKVLNVAGYSTFSVAQLTMQFILNFATRAIEHDKLVKQGAWQSSRIFTLTQFPSVDLEGKTLALIGYGAIGKKVEQMAFAFGMKIIKANIAGRPMRDGQVELSQALSQADFVSLHCPLSTETEGLVDKTFLKQMKPSAYLINTARGAIINEQDLADALKGGEIAGAGLDVLSQEPPTGDNPLLQQDVPNTIITPHIAWASVEAKEHLLKKMIEQLKKLLLV